MALYRKRSGEFIGDNSRCGDINNEHSPLRIAKNNSDTIGFNKAGNERDAMTVYKRVCRITVDRMDNTAITAVQYLYKLYRCVHM